MILEEFVRKCLICLKTKKTPQKSYQKNTCFEVLCFCISLRCSGMPAGNSNFVISHFHVGQAASPCWDSQNRHSSVWEGLLDNVEIKFLLVNTPDGRQGQWKCANPYSEEFIDVHRKMRFNAEIIPKNSIAAHRPEVLALNKLMLSGSGVLYGHNVPVCRAAYT